MDKRLNVVLGLFALCGFIFAEDIHAPGEDAPKMEKCGTEKRYCIGINSECDPDSKKCVCPIGYTGIPHLACYKEKYRHCDIVSDPRVITYGHPSTVGADLPLPCQIKAVNVKSTPKSADGAVCTNTVYFTEQRVYGNFYVSGVEVEVKYEKPDGSTGEVQFLVEGSAMAGKYLYKIYSRVGFTGSWKAPSEGLENLKITLGEGNVFKHSGNENLVKLCVEKCGLLVYFRPADGAIVQVTKQTQMSGLMIGLDTDLADYEVLTEGVCYDPSKEAGEGESSIEREARLLGLSEDNTMLYKALVSMTPSADMPDIERSLCKKTGDNMRNCGSSEDTRFAMSLCSFSLMKKPFVRCYSEESGLKSAVLKVFNDCLLTICPNHGVKDSCKSFEMAINNEKCKEQAPAVDEAINCDLLAAIGAGRAA